MGLQDLPTLAEMQQRRRCAKKEDVPTIADLKTQADKDDAALLRIWAAEVRVRDGSRCRHCDVETIRILDFHPQRSECHHIVSRTNKLIRYDVRNGVHLCGRCHHRLTIHRLFVAGTVRFTIGRTRKEYLDGKYVTFTTERPATC